MKIRNKQTARDVVIGCGLHVWIFQFFGYKIQHVPATNDHHLHH